MSSTTEARSVRREVEAFAKRHGLSVSTVCNRALGNTKFMDRLESREKRDRELIKKLRKYMRERDEQSKQPIT